MSKNVTKDSKESQVSIESKIRHLDEMVEWFYSEDFRSTKLLVITKSLSSSPPRLNKILLNLKTKLKLLRTSQKANSTNCFL